MKDTMKEESKHHGRKRGTVCIERVGGLSVLAFMLIKTFPT